MIDNFLEKVEKLKKIFDSYMLTFHKNINLKGKETEEVKVDELFESVEKQIKSDYKEENNTIFSGLRNEKKDLTINGEIISNLFKVNFFNRNLDAFEMVDESDIIEHLFMKLNEYLYYILGKMDSCIYYHNLNQEVTLISWNPNCEKDLDNLIQNGEKVEHLCKNLNLICAIDKENSENKEDLQDLVRLFFALSDDIYIKYEIKILNLNNYAFSSFSNKDIEIDMTYYKNNKKIKFQNKYRDKVNILHLSDMHIDSHRDANEYIQQFRKQFYNNDPIYKYDINRNEFIKSNKIKDIDLIVVTGDIANAGKSSKEILSNYFRAYHVIKNIAQSLLKNTWRSRLLIIPGNHDYGMINDLKIELKDRAYKNTELVDESNEFEKFIFFHFFFENRFSKDESQNTKNLNNPRLISYPFIFQDKSNNVVKNKKINFFLFNTAYSVNSIRSNKVGLKYDEDFLNKVLKQFDINSTSFQNENILLMHHTPLLEINYYFDIKYKLADYKNLIFGYTSGDINIINSYIENLCKRDLVNLENAHNNINSEIDKKNKEIILNIEEFKKLIESPKEINEYINALSNKEINYPTEKVSNLLKKYHQFEENKLPEEIKNAITKIFQEEVKKDLESRIETLEDIKQQNIRILDYLRFKYSEKVEINEIILKAGDKFFSYFIESFQDQKKFEENYQNYKEKLTPSCILGGHFHLQRVKKDDGCAICEAGVTFSKDKINYGIISINKDNTPPTLYSSCKLNKNGDLYKEESPN